VRCLKIALECAPRPACVGNCKLIPSPTVHISPLLPVFPARERCLLSAHSRSHNLTFSDSMDTILWPPSSVCAVDMRAKSCKHILQAPSMRAQMESAAVYLLRKTSTKLESGEENVSRSALRVASRVSRTISCFQDIGDRRKREHSCLRGVARGERREGEVFNLEHGASGAFLCLAATLAEDGL
jgi:hypothetical protein